MLSITKPRAFPLLNLPGSFWLHISLDGCNDHIAYISAVRIQQELNEPDRKSRASWQLIVFTYIFTALAHLIQANMRSKGSNNICFLVVSFILLHNDSVLQEKQS